jgi:V/A-type H+-transporting ATPase subunit I
MAIEELSEIFFVVKKRELKNFRNYLYKLGTVHIKDVSTLSEPPKVDINEEMLIREDLSKTDYIIKALEEVSPVKQSFIENFIPKRPIFTLEEIEQIKKDFSLKEFYLNVKNKFEKKRKAEEEIVILNAKLKDLKPFQNLNFRFEEIRKWKKVKVLFFYSSGKTFNELIKYTSLIENSYILEVPEVDAKDDEIFGFVFVIPASKFEDIVEIARKIGLLEINFSSLTGTPLENINLLLAKLKTAEKRKEELEKELKNLNCEKDKIILFSDVLKSELYKCEAIRAFADSKRVFLVEGYILSSSKEKVINSIEIDYPQIYYDIREIKNNPEAPVKLKNNEFFKPFEFIIRMFGIPKYGDIDPTPFTAVAFLILFGIAFGDLFYGLFLSLTCLYFMKKQKYDKGTVNFFKLFYYSGFSAAFFGLITGSWGGDLVSETYLNPNNPIVKIKNSLTIIDPLKDIMTMLIAIVILGVATQMYGIILAMISNLKNKNYKDAIFDQLSWLIFIPGGVIAAGNFLGPGTFSKDLINLGYGALIIGLIMIFLGGFIKSKSIINRIIKGFLNIYGIISSYGVSSLLADSLSYLRLLALSVATSSMAMSFNLVAFMFKDIKIIGPLFVIIVLIVTHLLNLLLSILGAFVHPVRLLFYEFFGRFYSNGGEEFKAFSEIQKNIIIKEEVS